MDFEVLSTSISDVNYEACLKVIVIKTCCVIAGGSHFGGAHNHYHNSHLLDLHLVLKSVKPNTIQVSYANNKLEHTSSLSSSVLVAIVLD